MISSLHPCNNNNPNRALNYKQYFKELNFDGSDCTNGFRCSDIHNFEKLNNVSINIIELNFYQDRKKWRLKLLPNEVSKNESDIVIDLFIYRNHYALMKKLKLFLGDNHKTFICRRCWNSYTSGNMLMSHKQKCGDDNMTTIKSSNESHLHWKDHFNKNPLDFSVYNDFEADNEKDNSSIGNKTSNIYMPIPVCNGYRIVSELENVLKSGHYKPPLGYENVNWFIDEIIKLEIKMAF